jgi:hypothetical protein
MNDAQYVNEIADLVERIKSLYPDAKKVTFEFMKMDFPECEGNPEPGVTITTE